MAMAKTRETQARNRKTFVSSQEQALRVNAIKTQFIRKAILRYVDSVMRRQNITHILSACSVLVKSQYRKRHKKIRTSVHFVLCKKHHLQCCGKWYKQRITHTHTHTHTQHTHTHTAKSHTHTPKSVQRNNEYKILWDFNIQTDKVIEYRLPDVVCINKQNRASDY